MARLAEKTRNAAPVRGRPAAAPLRVPRIVRVAQRLGRMIPDEELRRMPKDLSANIDHHAYGTPKK